MDTISSRENTNIMPLVGVIAGVIALLLAIVALVKVSSANKMLAAHEEKVAKIESIESQAGTASAAADKANNDIRKLTSQTQDAVNQIGTMISDLRATVTKIEESSKTRAVKGGSKGEAAVAGPGEYLVKKGDTGASIARSNGASLADLQAVNPSVNWSRLAIGQKVKLPAKK
ncbi:MAG: LysM domain-containing protein [Opitutaceae bacterium]|jgi:LysM repeat protein